MPDDVVQRELHGPALSETPGVGSLTISGFFDEVCTRFASNEALVFDDPLQEGRTIRWSYEQLHAQATEVAKALIAVGVEKSQPVAILMANRPEAVAAFFGAAMTGALVIPLSTFATRPELDYMIGHAGISYLMTQTVMGKRDLAADVVDLAAQVWAVGEDSWASFITGGEAISDEQVAETRDAIESSDVGVVIYSSGTTDRPKGVVHHQLAPTLQFWVQAQIFGRHQHTRMWSALPLFWTAGMNTAMGATLAVGGCWVMQEGFDAGTALRLMARERVTEPYTLPHQAKAMEEHPDWLSTDLSSLTCVFGKSVFSKHPSVTGDESWCMPVGYGLSETCAFFASHYSHDPRHLLRESIGRLLPGNVLRVIDPETGVLLSPGDEGELLIKGPTLMKHYIGKTVAESLDADGFFHTGDLGFFDAEGYLHWTGRRTEMIKTGGANVSPAEIEVALRACPPVKLSRVIGIPDPRLEQVAVLCLELKEGASATPEDIQAFLRERLAAYKVPKRILFFAEGEIPMTTSNTKVRDDALLILVNARLQPSK